MTDKVDAAVPRGRFADVYESQKRPRFADVYKPPELRLYDQWRSRSVNLHDQALRNLASMREKVAQYPSIGSEAVLSTAGGIWQHVRFGEKRDKHDEDLYRGYAMVEPEDAQVTLVTIGKVVDQRVSVGKGIEFKWLLSTARHAPVGRLDLYGDYSHLEIDTSRIVFYADSPEEIKEIFQQLVDCGWNTIEASRIAKCGGTVEGTPRRPGSNEFQDSKGEYWRSLNWNDVPGYSENIVDWKGEGAGRPMAKLTYPPRQKPPDNWYKPSK